MTKTKLESNFRTPLSPLDDLASPLGPVPILPSTFQQAGILMLGLPWWSSG